MGRSEGRFPRTWMLHQPAREAPHSLFVVDPSDPEVPGFVGQPSLQVLWRSAFARTRAVPLAARSRSDSSLRSEEVFPSPSGNRRVATPQQSSRSTVELSDGTWRIMSIGAPPAGSFTSAYT